jgi:deoxycytidine triphosphate deaminase
MFAVQPVKVYPGVPICQIFFHQVAGEITEYASDKYQHNQYDYDQYHNDQYHDHYHYDDKHHNNVKFNV